MSDSGDIENNELIKNDLIEQIQKKQNVIPPKNNSKH